MIAIVVIVFSVLNWNSDDNDISNLSDEEKEALLDEERDQEYLKINPLLRDHSPVDGNKESNVHVVIIEEFQCGHCADYHATIKALKKELKDEVLFAYKNVVMYDGSDKITEAAYAAGAQDKYFEYAELAQENQNQFYVKGLSSLKDWAKDVDGLDYSQWDDDRDSKKIAAQVEIDSKDVYELTLPEWEGLTRFSGTPTTIIYKNGEIVEWWSSKTNYTQTRANIEKYLD